MNVTEYFKEMYHNIWQSNDISRFDEYYAKDFQETISLSDDHKQPIEINMDYVHLKEQAKLQKDNYQDTTIDYKAIVPGENNHISVYFHSTSIVKKTGELQHRCVCGIWRLNENQQIDRVWAVVTPYYEH